MSIKKLIVLSLAIIGIYGHDVQGSWFNPFNFYSSNSATHGLTKQQIADNSLFSAQTKQDLRIAFANRANVNAKDNDGDTPLIKAIKQEKLEVVEELINVGADINMQGHSSKTPLMHAACQDRSETVQALINANADVNTQDNFGFTALMWAAIFNSPTSFKTLVKAPGINIDMQSSGGFTALMYAVNKHKIEEAVTLIDADADYKIVGDKNLGVISHTQGQRVCTGIINQDIFYTQLADLIHSQKESLDREFDAINCNEDRFIIWNAHRAKLNPKAQIQYAIHRQDLMKDFLAGYIIK